MTRSRVPARALATVVVLLALTATGCNAAPPPAATVGNSGEVSSADVLGLTAALAAADPQDQFIGDGKDTFKSEGTAGVLSFLIQQEVMVIAADRAGETITSQDEKNAVQELKVTLGGQAGEAQGAKVYAALPDEVRRHMLRGVAASFAVGRTVDDPAAVEAQLEAIYEQYKDQFSELCLQVLTVEDEATLAAVAERLNGGEDFAAVAKDVSIDDQAATGGDIGCTPVSQVPQEVSAQLATAQVGQIAGPFGAAPSLKVFKLTDRKAQPFATVRDAIQQQVGANILQQLAAGEAAKVAARTKIHVDPRFGRWSKVQGQVLPPVAPQPQQGTPTTAVPAP